MAVAHTMPTTVAASVSTLDSTSTCWSSRPRPAPIDARRPISRVRAAPRARSRLATFEQAMSSTHGDDHRERDERLRELLPHG